MRQSSTNVIDDENQQQEQAQQQQKSLNVSEISPDLPNQKSTPNTFPLTFLPSFIYKPSPAPKKRKRRPVDKVKQACVNCNYASKKCDEERPCRRCVEYDMADTCVPFVHKGRTGGYKRGPYKKKDQPRKYLRSKIPLINYEQIELFRDPCDPYGHLTAQMMARTYAIATAVNSNVKAVAGTKGKGYNKRVDREHKLSVLSHLCGLILHHRGTSRVEEMTQDTSSLSNDEHSREASSEDESKESS